jgi:myosin heavy subunit
MNPLKSIPIYGKSFSSQYQKSDNVRAKLPPHIYATAEQCYREMMHTKQSQCILISGYLNISN